eukprot:jgi/Tetstr1/435321/TSEL_024240.t1
MCGSGSSTEPKMVDAGEAVADEDIKTSAIAQARIDAGRSEAEDARMKQLPAILFRFQAPPPSRRGADRPAAPDVAVRGPRPRSTLLPPFRKPELLR